jgi:hypothetical protein
LPVVPVVLLVVGVLVVIDRQYLANPLVEGLVLNLLYLYLLQLSMR